VSFHGAFSSTNYSLIGKAGDPNLYYNVPTGGAHRFHFNNANPVSIGVNQILTQPFLEIASSNDYVILSSYTNSVYLDADQHIIFRTDASTERGRVNSAGRWLFGTTTDNGSDRVQVSGNTLLGTLRITDEGGGNTRIIASGVIALDAGNSVIFRDDSASPTYATIDSSGVNPTNLSASSLVFSTASGYLTSTVQSGCITSANLRTMLTDERGSGEAAFTNQPTISGSRADPEQALKNLLDALHTLTWINNTSTT
jgi:hypothetical protein